MRLKRTVEFHEWFEDCSAKEKAQITARLVHIEANQHFGNTRYLGDGLSELKWANGRRVYYAVSFDDLGNICILLLGGNKNGQDKDIKKARKILERETH